MKIFISHTNNDRPLADKIVEKLKSDGHIVHFDADNIRPGASWAAELTNAINSADAVIFLISKSSSENVIFEQELGLAISARYSERQTKIIPILLEKHVQIPFFLRDIIYLDLTESNSEEEFNHKIMQLLSSLKEAEPAGLVESQLYAREAAIAAAKKHLQMEKAFYIEEKKRHFRSLFLWTIMSTFIGLAAVATTLLNIFTDIQYIGIMALIFSMSGFCLALFVFYQQLQSEGKNSKSSEFIESIFSNFEKNKARGAYDD